MADELGGCGKNHSGVRVMAAGVDAGIFSVDNKRKGVHIGAEHDCGSGFCTVNVGNNTGSADAADRACEALVSVSQTLADQSITHQIAWFNRDTAQMEVVSITSLDDLSGEKARILSAGIAHDDEGILSRMLTADELTAARRILLFAPTQPVGTGAMEEKLTVLLPEDDPEGAISCLPEHMTRLLV